jgi:hypothetical protein
MMCPRPVRERMPWHLARLRTLPCCVLGCRDGRVEPHHLTHVQPKARGLKAGDQWTVPLCRAHHRAGFRDSLHSHGNERAWWEAQRVDPIHLAIRLWRESETGSNVSSGPV